MWPIKKVIRVIFSILAVIELEASLAEYTNAVYNIQCVKGHTADADRTRNRMSKTELDRQGETKHIASIHGNSPVICYTMEGKGTSYISTFDNCCLDIYNWR